MCELCGAALIHYLTNQRDYLLEKSLAVQDSRACQFCRLLETDFYGRFCEPVGMAVSSMPSSS